MPLDPEYAALASLGGSFVDAAVSNRNNKRTIAANKQLAEYSYSKDLEMWNRQNAYNTPQAQMLRLEQGGLNPNLVYGSGSVSGNTSGQMPKYNAPTVEYKQKAPDISAMLGTYQDIAMRNAQIDNLKAQTQSTQQRTLNDSITNQLLSTKSKYAEDSEHYKIENALKDSIRKGVDISNIRDLHPYNLEIKQQEAKQASANLDRIQLQNVFQRYRNDWMKLGVTSSDNVVFRMLVRQLNEMGIDIQQWLSSNVQ